jgi:hypothetical protein
MCNFTGTRFVTMSDKQIDSFLEHETVVTQSLLPLLQQSRT